MHVTKAMDDAKLTSQHWRIWFLAAMGIFLDGFDLFIIAVALPLIAEEFKTTPGLLGLIGASAPIGCIFGAALFGRFTDKMGRKALLLIDLLFFVVFAGASAFAWSISSLIVLRFLVGIGVGADYPVSSTYITENMPARLRGRMLVSGFGFQALGALSGALLGMLVLAIHPSLDAWRWMLGMAVVPAIIVLILRLWLPESPRWLLHHGEHERASEVASKMTGQDIEVTVTRPQMKTRYADLFTPTYIRRTLLTALSWFLMDIAFYGVGFFTPIILTLMAFTGKGDFISKDIASTHGAAFLDLFLVLGIVLAVILVEKWGRIKLQTLGFFGMALGLFVLAASEMVSGVPSAHMTFIFVGFILFNVMANMGPNPTTFLLPAEVFPTHLRATGHGFASAAGKVGAAVGIFFLPVLKATIGLPVTLVLLGFACLVGFALTAMLGYETKGRSLEELERVEAEMSEAEEGLINVQDDIKRLNMDIKRVEGALAKAIEEMRKARQ
ncbi:MAG: MFS transporter [Gammaproteobacteria bacterium]|nr:MFS transporter [Gammaproteobacteria bacterium]